MRQLILGMFLLIFQTQLSAQSTTIKGVIKGEDGLTVPHASISVLNDDKVGTYSNYEGVYELELNTKLPFTLIFSALGYEDLQVEVTKKNQEVNPVLKSDILGLNEVIISASRTPERIFESAVSVERVGPKELLNTTSPDFYDGLENKKGVDINTSSLVFKSINTRGFATFANTRFVQLVDGMDNTSPSLNFPLGNLIGLNELDVYSVEILPGASSALYGANAFNGMLFMRSKNPFTNEGISVYGKSGVTSSSNAGTNLYTSVGFRAAHKVSDRFCV